MLLGETMLRLEMATAGGIDAAVDASGAAAIRRRVIAQFADVPTAPYSIHNIALRGRSLKWSPRRTICPILLRAVPLYR